MIPALGDPNAWSYAIADGAPCVVAFSGGGDSTAALALACQTGKPVVAAIIDHGVREGSAADAARAAMVAETLGARAVVRRLSGLSGAQAQARTARYAALCAIARDAGAAALVLGHTADDQAETVLMRAARGAGPRGLAGMASLAWCPVWPQGRGVALCRPLLGVRRDDLRALLRERGLGWIEDPANANPRFDRTRARAVLAEAPDAKARLAAIAARLRPLIDAQDAAAWALWRAAGAIDEAGRVGLAAPLLWENTAAPRLVSAVLAAVGGAPRAPANSVAAALLARLRPGVRPSPKAASLAGAVARQSGDRLVIVREARRTGGRLTMDHPGPALVSQRIESLLTRPKPPPTAVTRV